MIDINTQEGVNKIVYFASCDLAKIFQKVLGIRFNTDLVVENAGDKIIKYVLTLTSGKGDVIILHLSPSTYFTHLHYYKVNGVFVDNNIISKNLRYEELRNFMAERVHRHARNISRNIVTRLRENGKYNRWVKAFINQMQLCDRLNDTTTHKQIK